MVRFLRAGSLVITLLAGFASAALAQNSPTQPIGRIEGADVTVDSGMPATVATRDTPASIYVSNGSVLTVHSGKARLLLLKGGELDICGPAKFTMLTSGNDITLALNFGRVHVQLPAKTSLKIFSPTIIATPIDINGGSRDVTIGLDVNDSLCVLATSGAIQLEHQFTGERLIVPQAGEFFLNDGTLVPVAGKAGSCGCTPMAEHPAPRAPARIPEFARAAPAQPEVTPEMPPPPASVRAAEARSDSPTTQTVQPGAVFVIPVHPEDEHPLALSEGQSAGEAPQIDGTLHGDVTPALSFMANAPQPPTDAEPEMMLLVSEAREAPDWQFDGHVDAPQFAKAMRQALGEESAATGASPSDNPSTRPAKKKRGFWGALKGLFFGNVEAAGPAK
ncbi:MAG: hypothetical protein ACRD5K_06055 [Candidatus Acidiferrales bacterium]